MKNTVKRYPFNLRKHMHDIEFRRNRAWNELHDIDDDTSDKAYALEALINKLNEFYYFIPDDRGIVWLEGKQIGLAKESVIWAENARAEANAGR